MTDSYENKRKAERDKRSHVQKRPAPEGTTTNIISKLREPLAKGELAMNLIFDHAHYRCADLDRAIEFYQRMLDAETSTCFIASKLIFLLLQALPPEFGTDKFQPVLSCHVNLYRPIQQSVFRVTQNVAPAF